MALQKGVSFLFQRWVFLTAQHQYTLLATESNRCKIHTPGNRKQQMQDSHTPGNRCKIHTLLPTDARFTLLATDARLTHSWQQKATDARSTHSCQQMQDPHTSGNRCKIHTLLATEIKQMQDSHTLGNRNKTDARFTPLATDARFTHSWQQK